MNTKLTLILAVLITTELWSSTSAHRDNGTVLAIPLLYDPNTNCKRANQSGEFIYGLVAASQSSKQTQTVLDVHNPECSECNCSYYTIQAVLYHHLHSENFNTCYTDVKCVSWLTLCEKSVFNLNYQILDNPTFAAVFVSFSPSFQQVLAVYPLPLPTKSSNVSHVYHIVHGRWQASKSRGFTIQNPYSTASDVSFQLVGEATAWMSSGELVQTEQNMTMKCREVLWIEPTINITEDYPAEDRPQTLSGTVLSSTTLLSVFTNLAPFYGNVTLRTYDNITLGFDYNSHLVHQMPERARWGRTFFIDGTHSEILPENLRSCLIYEVTIVSYTSTNKISLTNNASSIVTELKEPILVIPGEHYEYKLNFTQDQINNHIQSLEIHSTHPILVLCDTYSNTDLALCSDAVEYSTLVQPEEWYANKQIIVLVHPKASVTYHYHISILVPSNKSDPADIIESESDKFCRGKSLDSYDVQSHPMRGGRDYTLLTYEKNVVSSGETRTELLLRHSDPLTLMGVTVYGYSENLQYSYSNGYVLGTDFEDKDDFCEAKVVISHKSRTMALSLGSIFGVALPAITVSVILALMIRLRRRKKRPRAYNPLPPPDDEYPYDVFILCGDQDEGFVKECIEKPLKERGYTTMTKNTAPDGLFMSGNLVVADIDHVVKLCSRVIVVCSDNYTSRRSSGTRNSNGHCNVEINCCREMMSSNHSRIIPVVLDGAEATEFAEFTQHRIRTADILSGTKARSVFIKKLERDMNIKR